MSIIIDVTTQWTNLESNKQSRSLHDLMIFISTLHYEYSATLALLNTDDDTLLLQVFLLSFYGQMTLETVVNSIISKEGKSELLLRIA